MSDTGLLFYTNCMNCINNIKADFIATIFPYETKPSAGIQSNTEQALLGRYSPYTANNF